MLIAPHLLPSEAARSPVARTDWFFEVKSGVTVEMVLDPEFWAHIARRLKPKDRLEVLAEDGTFDLDLRVVSVDARGFWAQVRPLRIWQQTEETKAVDPPAGWPDKDGYRVEWGGNAHRWRILSPTGEIIDKGFGSEKDAAEGLKKIKGAVSTARAA